MPASRSSSRTPSRGSGRPQNTQNTPNRGTGRAGGPNRPRNTGSRPGGFRSGSRTTGSGDRAWGRDTRPQRTERWGDRDDRSSERSSDRYSDRSFDRRDDRSFDRRDDRSFDRRDDRRSDRWEDRRDERRDERPSARSTGRPAKNRWTDADRAARRPARDDRFRDDRPRQDRPRDDRPRQDRAGQDRFRNDRFRDDRFRDDRAERPRRERVVETRDEGIASVGITAEPAAPVAETTTFGDLGLGRDLVGAITALGATTPFPIQAATIPAVLSGRDVLGRGRTGSGKTLAFGAPLVSRIAAAGRAKKSYGRRPRALILAPTRELAMQINRTVTPLAKTARLFTTVVVGGVPQYKQVQGLSRGTDIVIGTPGRLEDLIEQGHLDLSEVGITVLDEADHMCDLGFLEPVQRLLRQTSEGGQKLLFSATLDRAVEALVAEFLTDPSVHEVPGEDQASATIDHRLLQIEHRDKVDVINDLVDPRGRTLVFARTRMYAETLAEALTERGLSTASLHGDLTQAKRTRNLKLLDEGRVQVLVATDVAARGIHVDDIDLVVQADPPEDPKTYLHRAGRTGRAGRPGTVVTLTTRQRRYKTERLLRDAEITAVSAVARPGDRILGELGRHAG
ncbi:superfamily II DNA/RNA helicase [Friedmanniella endophytica]|uniref:Superfamily II DNA/RNA helicase n=1 Tax=Microlunatus kandeliicorticis TaxID=1759536 RepID=A0A7W3P5I2_9ACTN|nr:DEAD/DEAH box helicase [Microlunatus kandeliicorticis]MBA8793890.1 superfamily II DNA/RNA helicase [Microlunatus kandeliicorticis]